MNLIQPSSYICQSLNFDPVPLYSADTLPSPAGEPLPSPVRPAAGLDLTRHYADKLAAASVLTPGAPAHLMSPAANLAYRQGKDGGGFTATKLCF